MDNNSNATKTNAQKCTIIDETQLEQVAGGWSENRYDPNVCGKLTAPRLECTGTQLVVRWCDHYRVREWTEVTKGYEYKHKTYSCVMNGFPEYTVSRL